MLPIGGLILQEPSTSFFNATDNNNPLPKEYFNNTYYT